MAQREDSGPPPPATPPSLLLAPLPARPKPRPRGRALFVDLDGVLADFDAGVRAVLGAPPEAFHARTLWPALARVPGGFFRTLAPMADAAELWTHCSAFESVTILTGMPMGDWAEPQKRTWCAERLGLTGERVITCFARDKHVYATPGAVLVDDSERHREPWERAGGTFVLHVNAATSLARLRALGFL